jgi:hypothetical protein
MKGKLSVLTPFCVEQSWCHRLVLALIHVEPKKSFSLRPFPPAKVVKVRITAYSGRINNTHCQKTSFKNFIAGINNQHGERKTKTLIDVAVNLSTVPQNYLAYILKQLFV